MAQRLVRAKGKIRDARDPVSRARRGRSAGPAARRARGRLSHLQRGLHGELRRAAGSRGALRGGDPPRPAARRADARRAGGDGPAGADAAHRVAPRHARSARTASSSCWPTRTARRWDRDAHRRGAGDRPRAASGATSPVRTRSRRRSTPCTATRRPRPPPTGGRSCSSTTSCWRSRRARSSRSIARSRSPKSRDRRRRSRSSTARPRSTTTCSTRFAPTCCGAWAGTPRPRGVRGGDRAHRERGRARASAAPARHAALIKRSRGA